MLIEFEIPVPPVAKERARVTRFGSYTPARTREFTRQVEVHLKRIYKHDLLSGPIKLNVEFHLSKPKRPMSWCKTYPAMRPDVDNYLKALLDSCNKILWKDDALVCDVRCKKVYAELKPMIKIRIEEL